VCIVDNLLYVLLFDPSKMYTQSWNCVGLLKNFENISRIAFVICLWTVTFYIDFLFLRVSTEFYIFRWRFKLESKRPNFVLNFIVTYVMILIILKYYIKLKNYIKIFLIYNCIHLLRLIPLTALTLITLFHSYCLFKFWDSYIFVFYLY